VVSERHQGREELEDDYGVDMVDLFPYGIGDSVRAWRRGGGGFGEGEFYFIFGEWGDRGLL